MNLWIIEIMWKIFLGFFKVTFIYYHLLVCLRLSVNTQTQYTYNTATWKPLDTRNTQEKKFGPTKFPVEKRLDPWNTKPR